MVGSGMMGFNIFNSTNKHHFLDLDSSILLPDAASCSLQVL